MKLSICVLFTMLVALLSVSCVSVNIGHQETKHASGVHYVEPKAPFVSEKRADVDAAWKNPKNGNLISFLSDCQDDSDPTLETIVQGALSGLSETRVESTSAPQFQGRESRRVLASGKVDGVASKIDLMVFKRNSCIYMLSYVGVANDFDQSHAEFDRFIDGFRTP